MKAYTGNVVLCFGLEVWVESFFDIGSLCSLGEYKSKITDAAMKKKPGWKVSYIQADEVTSWVLEAVLKAGYKPPEESNA